MADNLTPEQRHRNMANIQSTNSKPEEIVRKYLFHRGLRYRKNVRALPGTPDIVLPKYKTVIFVHGCFWHHHDCGRFRWPASNVEYWKKKIHGNEAHDREVYKALVELGWRVLIIWECELRKKCREERLKLLYDTVTQKT